MKAVIQRVDSSSVSVDDQVVGKIELGLLILLGIEDDDSEEDSEWLSLKIAHMRIFTDKKNKMNLDIRDVNGEALVISQFTLHASTKKGNRPSFIKAAQADKANHLYTDFIGRMNSHLKTEVRSGRFGAMMNVSLINNGPVTIIIDSKNKV